MISRRTFLTTVAGGLLAAPRAAEAQQPPQRIGLLDYAASSPVRLRWWKVFHDRLRELGYVEGQTLALESRWASGEVDRLPALATDLIQRKVVLIVTAGSAAAVAAKRATNTVPIVMADGADPVALGLAASLARPGGNVTGLTSVTNELGAKRLELLRELMPRAQRVAVLWDRGNPSSGLTMHDVQIAAQPLGLTLESVAVRGANDFEDAFSAMARQHVDAVFVVQGPAFISVARQIAELAIKHRLPTVTGSREYVDAGQLLSYGTDYPELFRRAAEYVDKILKGDKPADLPIEQPTKFELVINLKTAKALGLTIPQALLLRADEVVQ